MDSVRTESQEITLDGDFKSCPPLSYNHYSRAVVIFYKETSDSLEFLLHSNSTDGVYTTSQSNFSGIDSAITFTAVRAILEGTYGCLAPSLLQQIQSQQKVSEEDLIITQTSTICDIWRNKLYVEWLKVINACKCQYDAYEGLMVYFLKIDPFDVGFLNQNLRELKLDISFSWFSHERMLQEKLDSFTQKLAVSVDFPKHIKEANEYNSLPLSEQNIYILLLCKPDAAGTPLDLFYDHLPGLFWGIYKRNKETWFLYNAAKGEFPPEDVIRSAKGLVIPGSPSQAYSKDEWLMKTRDWLREFHLNYTKTKFLGICYGEQLICEALGGKTDMMPQKKDNSTFFLAKIEDVELAPEFFEQSFVKRMNLTIPPQIKMMQVHSDEVVTLPEGFKVLGKSPSCGIEVIASEDNRYFGFQGHPEYTADYFAARGVLFQAFLKKEAVTPDYFKENYQKIRSTYFSGETDTFLNRKICYEFLKN